MLTILQNKHAILGKIRSRLTSLTYENDETCTLLDELDATKDQLETKTRLCDTFQCQITQLEKSVAEQTSTNKTLQDENQRLNALTQKQSQDLRHAEQLRQSIVIFEKKLDQKQTRVNELSMKIIEKEDIIETKVKECQKHRLELRELETKYYTLGKQLEEQIISMSKEMEKLNVEKEMLKFDLESLRLNQQGDRPKSSAEEELARLKAECRQQIVEGEIESLKLRLNQSNHERDELLKVVKEFEKKYKELQIKADADEQTWTRMKNDMLDKQRKVRRTTSSSFIAKCFFPFSVRRKYQIEIGAAERRRSSSTEITRHGNAQSGETEQIQFGQTAVGNSPVGTGRKTERTRRTIVQSDETATQRFGSALEERTRRIAETTSAIATADGRFTEAVDQSRRSSAHHGENQRFAHGKRIVVEQNQRFGIGRRRRSTVEKRNSTFA